MKTKMLTKLTASINPPYQSNEVSAPPSPPRAKAFQLTIQHKRSNDRDVTPQQIRSFRLGPKRQGGRHESPWFWKPAAMHHKSDHFRSRTRSKALRRRTDHNQPCRYFRKAKMTPQQRKPQLDSMIIHYHPASGNISFLGCLKHPEQGIWKQQRGGLTTIPVLTPFFRIGIRHRSLSNLYYSPRTRTRKPAAPNPPISLIQLKRK